MKCTTSRLVALVLVAACTRGAAVPSASQADGGLPTLRGLDYAAVIDTVSLDTKTPDHALRSWWHWTEVNDSLMSAERRLPDVARERSRLQTRLGAILTSDALAEARNGASPTPEQIRREIIEVKNESDTRAVVLARITNITPVPPSATPTEYDIKRRRDGELFRYIFDRDSTGWKLAQVQAKDVVNDTLWVDRYHPDRAYVPSWVSP